MSGLQDDDGKVRHSALLGLSTPLFSIGGDHSQAFLHPLPHLHLEIVSMGDKEVDAGAELDQANNLTSFNRILLLEIGHNSPGNEAGDLSNPYHVAVVSLEHGNDVLVQLSGVLSKRSDFSARSITRTYYTTFNRGPLHMDIKNRKEGDDPVKLAISYEGLCDYVDFRHPSVGRSQDA